MGGNVFLHLLYQMCIRDRLYRQVDTAVQESQIHTDVPLLLGLPFDGSSRYIGGAIPHTQTGRHTTHGCTPSITTDVGITSLSPSQTELTVMTALQTSVPRTVGQASIRCV